MKVKNGFILFILFFFCGCAILSPCKKNIKIGPKIKTELLRVADVNKDLQSAKGIGKIKITDKYGVLQSFKIAWLFLRPDKLRIEILMVSGQPAARIATDGKYFYMDLGAFYKHKFSQKKKKNPNLYKLLKIDIYVNDLIKLLSGVIPYGSYDYANLVEDKITREKKIFLKKCRGCVSEKISFNFGSAYKKEQYKKEKFVYGAVFLEKVDVDGFILPSRLLISGKKKVEILLDVRRCWVNVNVLPSKFVLKKM
jgi:hypothetical protein